MAADDGGLLRRQCRKENFTKGLHTDATGRYDSRPFDETPFDEGFGNTL